VVWGAGFLAVFAIYRSVLPLMLGHFLYDALVAGSPVVPDTWGAYMTVFVLVLGGTFAASYVRLPGLGQTIHNRTSRSRGIATDRLLNGDAARSDNAADLSRGTSA